jgi:hypothetical protein
MGINLGPIIKAVEGLCDALKENAKATNRLAAAQEKVANASE